MQLPTTTRNHPQPPKKPPTTVRSDPRPPKKPPKTIHNPLPPPHNHPQPSTTMHDYLKTTQKSKNLSETVMSLHFRCSY